MHHINYNKFLFSCVRFIAIILVFMLLPIQQSFAQQSRGNARVNINDNTRIDRTPNDSTPFPIPVITIQVDPSRERSQIGTGLQILILLTILSLAPSILIMTTSFTRILIVLNFVRRALGTNTEPSNQILIGLALFITFFTMSPVIDQVYNQGIKPYIDREIDYVECYNRSIKPIRTFMFKHTRESDMLLFAGMEGAPKPQTRDDFSTIALVSAFITSELRTAFQMGVVIYLPFLVIDMLVSSVLMAMGMMMLPPAMISLPFKLLLFILVDGWNLVIKSLVTSITGA